MLKLTLLSPGGAGDSGGVGVGLSDPDPHGVGTSRIGDKFRKAGEGTSRRIEAERPALADEVESKTAT